MNEIQIFQNEQFGSIRTVDKNGETWFVAADVCRALDLGNPTQALVRLDADEKGNTLISNEGIRGNPNATIVSESGLYSLVLGSRKPEARAFKRWVTHDVLPAIRRHGLYAVDEVRNDPDKVSEAMKLFNEERDKNVKLAFENNDMLWALRRKDKLLSLYRAEADEDGLLDIRGTAQALGWKERDFIAHLMYAGVLYRRNNGRVCVYAKYREKLFVVKGSRLFTDAQMREKLALKLWIEE